MAIYLRTEPIISDWTDYNGHMNVAYYVLIFDQFGSEVLLTNFDMGEYSAKTTKKSNGSKNYCKPCNDCFIYIHV